MLVIELTNEEARLLYSLLSDKYKELESTMWVNGTPSRNIRGILNRMELTQDLQLKLIGLIKKQADIGFTLEREEKENPKFTNGTFDTQFRIHSFKKEE